MKRVKRPCDECPWRKDSEPGRFARERWDALTLTSMREDQSSANLGDPLFACHKTPEDGERACAGWLAVEGLNHPTVRFALITGSLPGCAVNPPADWPDLHPDFATTRAHDLMET